MDVVRERQRCGEVQYVDVRFCVYMEIEYTHSSALTVARVVRRGEGPVPTAHWHPRPVESPPAARLAICRLDLWLCGGVGISRTALPPSSTQIPSTLALAEKTILTTHAASRLLPHRSPLLLSAPSRAVLHPGQSLPLPPNNPTSLLAPSPAV